MRPPRRIVLVVLGATALLAASCTPSRVAPLPPAPSIPETTTTAVADFRGVGLPGVPGRTTTTIGLGPGKATLTGKVLGPDGPVPGAVVRAERLVGDAAATVDLLAQPDGTYSLAAVLGGRYRVRAWKPAPDNLALVEPEVFFLEGSEKKALDLRVQRYQGVSVTAAIAPDPPPVGGPANLLVQVVNREVDGNGVVRSAPVPAIKVELFGSGDWRVLTINPVAADGGGRARWQLECRRAGNQPLAVVVGDSSTFNLNLPGCAVPPPPVEPIDPGGPDEPATTTSTTAPGATTTTTRPSSTTTTTSTAPPRSTTTTRR